MGLRITDHPRQGNAAFAHFRPVVLTITCDMGSLFCETFDRETSWAISYVDLMSEATALGWKQVGWRFACPICAHGKPSAVTVPDDKSEP